MNSLLGARHSRRSNLRLGGAIIFCVHKDAPQEWRVPSKDDDLNLPRRDLGVVPMAPI
jgi:hypothetical protein